MEVHGGPWKLPVSFPWTSMACSDPHGISVEAHGTPWSFVGPMWSHPWKLHGLGWSHYGSSIEFHGHPWNFHGIDKIVSMIGFVKTSFDVCSFFPSFLPLPCEQKLHLHTRSDVLEILAASPDSCPNWRNNSPKPGCTPADQCGKGACMYHKASRSFYPVVHNGHTYLSRTGHQVAHFVS